MSHVRGGKAALYLVLTVSSNIMLVSSSPIFFPVICSSILTVSVSDEPMTSFISIFCFSSTLVDAALVLDVAIASTDELSLTDDEHPVIILAKATANIMGTNMVFFIIIPSRKFNI